MTTYHMKQSIAGCLRNNRIGTIDFLEDVNGKPLSDAEARIELNKLLEAGHTVMPVGDDCEGFDVFGGGCPGHEPLAGSALCHAMLKRGDKYVMCAVSMADDETALSEEAVTLHRIVISLDKDWLYTDTGTRWHFAVPINNQGEPLTAKEVGL